MVVADAERERERSRAFAFGTREKIIVFFFFSNVSFLSDVPILKTNEEGAF